MNDSLCVNHNVIHAAGSFCTESSTNGNHFCNYVGERMTFYSAVEECMVYLLILVRIHGQEETHALIHIPTLGHRQGVKCVPRYPSRHTKFPM